MLSPSSSDQSTGLLNPSSHVGDLPVMILLVAVAVMILLVVVAVISGLLISPSQGSNSTHQPHPTIMATVPDNKESDPSVLAATSAEIIQLMFKFIGEQIEEERKLTKEHSDADRELTDAKILKVISE